MVNVDAMYTQPTLSERVADAIIHAVAIAASIAAVAVLLTLAIPSLPAGSSASLWVYGLTLIAMFCFSAAYNHLPVPHWKPLLKRFDQAAIYVKIAGAYTPFTVLIGGPYGYTILAIVWVAATLGVVGKLFTSDGLDRLSVVFYLALGWLSLFIVWPLSAAVPVTALLLIFAGGCLYSIGVIFHLWESLKFQNAIWHGFVVAAASCHYVAIVQSSFSV